MPDSTWSEESAATDLPEWVELGRLAPAILVALRESAAAHRKSVGDEALLLLTRALQAPADARSDAGFLTEHLGSFPVAALTGTQDGRLPMRWAEPGGPVPGEDAAELMRIARAIWAELADAHDDNAARRWFLRHHPLLGGDTPLVAIREGRTADLAAAVAAAIHTG